MEIVATTSLPAVDRPNADRWNAARSCQKWLYRGRLASLKGLQQWYTVEKGHMKAIPH